MQNHQFSAEKSTKILHIKRFHLLYNSKQEHADHLKAPPRRVHTGTLSNLPKRSQRAMSIPEMAWIDLLLRATDLFDVFLISSGAIV